MLQKKWNDHIDFARACAIYPDQGTCSGAEIGYLALGLVCEAGEAGDVLKKVMRQDSEMTGLQRVKFIEEIGDMMWYLARLCGVLQIDLGYVLDRNVEKLEGRIAAGTVANEAARDETDPPEAA